jgi:hypothetical protein
MSPRLRFGGAVVAEAVNVLALDVTFEDFFGAQDVQSAGASSVLKKVAQGLRMEALAEELGLGEEEQKLALALAAALGSDVDAVASAVVGARVTREDVQQHAVEIGCPKLLTPQVKSGIMKFAQFVKTIEALGVVRFEGTLEGRSLLVRLFCLFCLFCLLLFDWKVGNTNRHKRAGARGDCGGGRGALARGAARGGGLCVFQERWEHY